MPSRRVIHWCSFVIAIMPTKWPKLKCTEPGKREKKIAYLCVRTCISWSLGVLGSVYVWMLDQARWWFGWLVLAELISQFPSWGEMNANRLSCCFPDQAGCFLMRQADRVLSRWRGRLTHENETPIRMLGSGREDWEGPRGRRSEGGGYQLSEDWVTGQGRWLSSKTPPRSFEWQETKGMSLHTQQWLQTLLSGLSLSSDRPTRTNPVLLRDCSPTKSISRTSLIDLHLELLNLSLCQPKFKELSMFFLSKFLPGSLSFDFSLW